MNTWITALCPHCHAEQRQRAHKYRLFRCTTLTGRDFYTFTCLKCDLPAVKPVNTEITCILLGAQVPVQRYELPMELGDPLRSALVPLGSDDLLDLLIDLENWDGVVNERTH